MAKEIINTGTNPDDGTGDTLRTAFTKANANFTELYDADFDGVVKVKPGNSFGFIDSSKVYQLDAGLNTLTESIQIPTGGITIRGLGAEISGLTNSNGFIFTSPVGGSGTVNLIDMYVTGDVFNLTDGDGTNALECVNINYINCDTLGSITDYRQYSELNVGRFGGTPTFTFNGSMNGIFITPSIVRGVGATTVLFKEGTGLTLGAAGRFFTNMNLELPTGAVFCDFQDSNFTVDEQFQIVGANFSGLANNAAYLPNLGNDSTKLAISNSRGLINSYPGIVSKITSQTATSVTEDIPSIIAATTISLTQAEWFTGLTDEMSVRYLSTSPRYFRCEGFITIDGGSGDNYILRMRHYDNSLGSYIDIDDAFGEIPIGGTTSLSVFASVLLEENDRIELWIINTSNSNNPTIQNGSKILVSPRSGI